MNRHTLLFVGAHPDDETFGVGGTLAHYAALGVRVYYVSGTRGEVGMVSPELMQGHASVGDLRWAELECAAKALGLAGVFCLGYRDSGMPGSEDNKHPRALVRAPIEEVADRIVQVIRRIRPDIVVTFDPIGGYRHPDHITIHTATAAAFHAAGDGRQYPEAGAAFQSQKLYYHVFPRGWLRAMVRLMPLFGKDPRRFGRNKDIDLASLAGVAFPIHAVIRLTKASKETRDRAMKCHASQSDGSPRRKSLLTTLSGLFGQADTFMRAYPPVVSRRKERDLFEGLHQ